jgi:hypothetical protein
MRLIATLLMTSAIANAQCKLGPLTPIPVPKKIDRRVANSEMPWPHLALLVDGGTENATMIDPLDPKRFLAVDSGVKYAVYTPTRAVALAPYDGKLFVGGKPMYQAQNLRPLLDAVDGAHGETWIVIADRVLQLLRVNAAGKVTHTKVTAPWEPLSARLTRLVDGRLALAWLAVPGGRFRRVTSLWLSFFDSKGAPIGSAQRLDAAADLQQLADVVLAPSGAGVVVGWNPIAGKGDKKQLPIELRLFHVDPGAAPKLVRRDSLTSELWNVAGSAGGYLPNYVQAGRSAVIWLVEEGLFGAPAEGGPPTLLIKEPPGEPRLRDGTLIFWDRNQGHHVRATLSCGAATPATLPTLPPPPPDPVIPKFADVENAWQHMVAIVKTNPEAAKKLGELEEDKPHKLAELVEREAIDCVLAAKTLADLERCGWP